MDFLLKIINISALIHIIYLSPFYFQYKICIIRYFKVSIIAINILSYENFRVKLAKLNLDHI